MKLTILQENFIQGLSIVNRIISPRAQLPILSNILLKTENNQLKLAATNLETSISLWLGAKIEKEGAITIPAKILTEFVSFLSADKVSLFLEETTLKVVGKNSEAFFNGIPASEFPSLPQKEEKNKIVFTSSEFFSLVSQVAFAVATDEGRPVLTGVKFEKKEEGLILAATDGYRLSVKTLPEFNFKLNESLIIPGRVLVEAGRIVSEKKEEKIEACFTKKKNQIVFLIPNMEIASRLIEGEFPDFQKIIPSSYETKIILEKEEFLKAVKIAAIFAREAANLVKLKVGKGGLTISANMPQVGGNKTTVKGKVEGEENEVAFNARFLIEFLNSVSSEEITFETKGSLSPGVFKLVGDDSLIHIIMPVRIQGEEKGE